MIRGRASALCRLFQYRSEIVLRTHGQKLRSGGRMSRIWHGGALADISARNWRSRELSLVPLMLPPSMLPPSPMFFFGWIVFWNWLCAVQHQHHADGHASTVRDLLPPLRALRSLPAIPGFAVSTWVCRAVLLVTSASALAANGPT
jgi:hypothetical protein